MAAFSRLSYWIWLVGISHGFVWGPCVLLDFFFCKGKMLRDPFSLILIEVVSLIFLAAKHRQLQKQRPE